MSKFIAFCWLKVSLALNIKLNPAKLFDLVILVHLAVHTHNWCVRVVKVPFLDVSFRLEPICLKFVVDMFPPVYRVPSNSVDHLIPVVLVSPDTCDASGWNINCFTDSIGLTHEW